MNNAVSKSIVSGNDYYAYFVPKTAYSNLPSCSQFLNSEHKLTFYTGRSYDIVGAAKAAEQSCTSYTSQSCSIVFSEKRNFCIGQTGQCTPRYSSNIIQSTCYIDQYRHLIAEEMRLAARKAAEERSNAIISTWRSECTKMGFSVDTTEFSNCILSLKEIAARAEIHERSRVQYETTLAEIRREREEDANLRLMQLGLGMAAGGRSSGGYSSSRSLPTIPPPPPPITIIAPSGNRYNCSTFGTTVNCR
jgi:hypothetical protein